MSIEKHKYTKIDAHSVVNQLRRRFDVGVGAYHEDSGQYRIDIETATDDISYWMDERIWLVWPLKQSDLPFCGHGYLALFRWLDQGGD